ncbi:MFS transporter [Burkholderia ubonensis]|uniref:Bcr/CflA family efflux transporter n=1 Tax=Burkholderia ubonensis TaxID=101571 RepID=A0AA40R491_9BURK|nr:multidrug effflux MFS transporter [Burkholderia ubonensis]KVD34227.1 MFS transporter [Burkholderia ubonensis]KVG39235.1 MFS transporter [Burkholderia ubonensis]KVO91484.1 MFS transporter [Burkholderia ubonensis]KVU12305.1 MFS transporter [Burkholderia ubonensis]KVZ54517.1 MFS transporter [Burkholderia ubonensis]
MKTRSLPQWGWLLLLMLVVCLPRVTIDAYLPSLPAMADALHGTDAQMQLTLTLYMAGYALSMLVSGPLSDRYGRRPVLLGGLCLYVAASVACALSTSIPALVCARIFQALGGCSGTVIGRVIVRERFPAAMQATMLSRISAGMALSPVIAPLAGSAVAEWLGWRGVFAWLAAGGLVATAMVLRHLPETRERDTRPAPGPGLLRTYAGLLRERRFLRYSLAISLVYCTYFPFIAESSALFQRQMGVSGPVYAAIFGLTVLGYLIGSSVFRRSSGRWKADSVIAAAACINVAGAVMLWAGGAVAPASAAAIVVPMSFVMVAVGIAIPACQFAVMQPYTTIAGTASGLFFFIQMAIAAGCGGVLAWWSDGTARPMIAVTVCASVAFLGVVVGLRERSAGPAGGAGAEKAEAAG